MRRSWGREPQRAHARRLGGDVRAARGRPAAELRGSARPHRRPARPRAALPPAARARCRSGSTSRCGSTPGLRPRRAHPPLRRRAAGGARRRGAVGAAGARPAAVGALDRRPSSPTGASASSARRTTAWSTASPRSSSARCCSTRARADARRPRRAGAPRRRRTRSSCWPAARWDRAREQLGCCARRSRLARAPLCAAGLALRTARALAGAVLPLAPRERAQRARLARPRTSPRARRPLDDLREIRSALRRDGQRRRARRRAPARCGAMPERRGEPARLKAMVPVNVRGAEDAGELGNRISFVFVELPARRARPARRLWRRAARRRARARRAACRRTPTRRCRRSPYAPRPLQRALSHARRQPADVQPRRLEHPRPADAAVHARLPAREAYPVVPLADGHALSIGMTTVGDDACFGLYADRRDAARRRPARPTSTRRSTSCVRRHGAMADPHPAPFRLGDPVRRSPCRTPRAPSTASRSRTPRPPP